ncbi:MAG: glycerophosphodiester phosphodiesterase [Calditrichia bacterium]|nr:glycerophosphodiester phosphodiesterase [Calditrichia bacterium]
MKNNPLIISHRGDTSQHIENTISAADEAIKLGATGLEIDVRQCGTGEIVVFHDFSLRRMFNKNGYVGRTNFNDLKHLKYIKNGIPTEYTIDLLEEFFQRFKNTVKINLDAKTIHFFDLKFADQLISIINNHNLFQSVWISCFNPFLLQILKINSKKIQTGYLFQRTACLHTAYDRLVFTDAWHPYFNIINKTLLNKAKRLGKKLYVWTVNDIETINKLKDTSIDGIITDNVKFVKETLKSQKNDSPI